MREKLVSICDDFWIENEHGHVLCKLQEHKLHVKNTMEVEEPDSKQVVMVKKAIISPVRDRFTVKIKDGPDLEDKATFWTTSRRSVAAETDYRLLVEAVDANRIVAVRGS